MNVKHSWLELEIKIECNSIFVPKRQLCTDAKIKRQVELLPPSITNTWTKVSGHDSRGQDNV